MAELQFPNIVGSFQNGLAFGTQLGQQKQAEQRRNRLADLSAQAFGAAPEARSGLVQQAIATDPEAGFALDRQLQSGDDARTQTLVNGAKLIVSAKDPAQKAAWYARLAPSLRNMGMQVPDQYAGNEALIDDTAQSIVAAYSPGDQQRNLAVSPGSAIVNPQTGAIVYERPYTPQNQTISVAGEDGRPRQFTFDVRSGTYVPANVGGVASAPGATVNIDGMPPEQAQKLAAGVTALQQAGAPEEAIRAFEQAILSQPREAAPSPFVGQSPGERKFAEEAGQQAAQLGALRQRGQIEAENEGIKTAARERAQAQEQRLATVPQVITKADQTLALINKALTHPGRSTATGLSSVFDPRNYAPGTDAKDFQVLLDQLKGQTFLEAFQSLKGGGAITQVEGTKAEQAIARLNTAQSDEAFEAALRDLAAVAQGAKERALGQIGGPQSPQQPGGVDDLLSKYGAR